MNYKISLIIVFILFAIFQSHAQKKTETPTTKNDFKKILKVQPLYLVYGKVALGYEHQIAKRGSIDFNTKYNFSDLSLSNNETFDKFKLHQITLDVGYRHYFTKKENRLQGFYMAGGLLGNYQFAKINPNTIKIEDLYSIGADIKIGYQFVFNKFLKGLTVEHYWSPLLHCVWTTWTP